MRSPKLFGAIAFVFFLSAIGAHAAPYFTYNPTLLPQLNASFDLGTSTDPWRAGYFGTLCIAGDCRTVWPGGGSSGSTLATTSPWVAGNLAQVLDNGHVTSIATSSLNLTTSSFNSAAVSQWTNDAGYITSAGAQSVATSTHEVSGQVAVFSSNSATPATIAGNTGLIFDGTNLGINSPTLANELEVGGSAVIGTQNLDVAAPANGLLVQGKAVFGATTTPTGGTTGTGIITAYVNATSPFTNTGQFTNALAIAQINPSQTDNTYEGNDFGEVNSAGTTFITARIAAINTAHTAGSEAGELKFLTASGGLLGLAEYLTSTNQASFGGSATQAASNLYSTFNITATSSNTTSLPPLVLYGNRTAYLKGTKIGGFGVVSADSNFTLATGPLVTEITSLSEEPQTAATQATGIGFYTTATGGTATDTEKMYLSGGGNLGIGTTSPYALLSVGGNVVVGASTAGGTLGDLYLSKLGTAAGAFLAVDPTGKVIATTTPSGGSGTVTSIATNNGITGGTITTTGTIGLAAIAANSVLANRTSASAVPTALATSSLGIALTDTTGTLGVARGGTGIGTFVTGGRLLYGSGTNPLQEVATTSFAVSSSFSYSGTLGALVGGANGTLSIANAGISNVMLANSTISGVALGSSLNSLTHDTTLSGTSYNGSAAVSDWGLNLGNSNTWTVAQMFSGNVGISSSSPQFPFSFGTLTSGVYINGSGELVSYDIRNGWTGRISPTRFLMLQTGTTTTWTATTTAAYIPYVVAPFSGTLQNIKCKTDASFLGVNVQINGSNIAPSYFVASTTVGTTTFTGSNTFNAGDKLAAIVGTTTTSGASTISCTIAATETP